LSQKFIVATVLSSILLCQIGLFAVAEAEKTPDFGLQRSQEIHEIEQGVFGDQRTRLTVSTLNGFNSQIDIVVTVDPKDSGVSARINGKTSLKIDPHKDSPSLSVDAAHDAPTGEYKVTITGTSIVNGQKIIRSTFFIVKVKPPSEFYIEANPAELTIPQGGVGFTTIKTTATKSFQNQINLQAMFRSGFSGKFSGDGKSTMDVLSQSYFNWFIEPKQNKPTSTRLDIQVDPQVLPGTYKATIEAVMQNVQFSPPNHQIPVIIHVTANPVIQSEHQIIQKDTTKSTDTKTGNKKTGKTTSQLKNDLKKLYQIGKYGEKITSIIKKANDDEAKTLKKLSGDTKSIYSKTKSPEAKKLGDKIQEQLKDTEKDKKQIDALDTDSKKIAKQILDIAKDNKITKSELEQIDKKSKDDLSLTPSKKEVGLEYYNELKNELENTVAKMLADDVRIPWKEQKSDSKNTKSENPDAPPESILDDIDISGPDASAPKKSDQGIKHGESVPGLGRYGVDWGDTYEDMMMLLKQQTIDLQKQTNDQTVLVDIQHQFDGLKQKVVIEDPKKAIIQKEPTKLPDSKIDNTKKPTQVQPKSNPIETKEKPIIQKDPIITEPKPSNTKPTLSIPKQVTQEATGPNGANVSFSTSSQDKEDGSLTPTCTPASGSVFPIGATAVSCTVTDSNGNSVSGTFTVTVRDTTPPAFSPFQPTEGVRDDTGVQVFFDVTANDLVDGNVPVICNYQSGYKFPPGVTELKCTASDSRGNQSTKTVQITVTVTESGQ
jgi:hypothetical protein